MTVRTTRSRISISVPRHIQSDFLAQLQALISEISFSTLNRVRARLPEKLRGRLPYPLPIN